MDEKEIERQLDILCTGTSDVINKKELAAKLKKGKPLRIKFGIDPTSADIHIGHAVVLRKLKQFQDLGHKAIAAENPIDKRVNFLNLDQYSFVSQSEEHLVLDGWNH